VIAFVPNMAATKGFVMIKIFTFVLLAFAAAGIQSAKAAETAIFAGGCFWCVESDFDHVNGVISTTSGYIGGTLENPNYHNYSKAGFREAVAIKFNPGVVSYQQLVDIFFRSVDPTDAGGQFCDRGHAYTTAIYALSRDQANVAKAERAKAKKALGRGIVTPIEGPAKFWPAEGYHQNYYKKNPLRYRYYRNGCGRDARVEELWGSQAHQGIAAH
jgi:peptide-methionine (S)-S-oxide reductase